MIGMYLPDKKENKLELGFLVLILDSVTVTVVVVRSCP